MEINRYDALKENLNFEIQLTEWKRMGKQLFWFCLQVTEYLFLETQQINLPGVFLCVINCYKFAKRNFLTPLHKHPRKTIIILVSFLILLRSFECPNWLPNLDISILECKCDDIVE